MPFIDQTESAAQRDIRGQNFGHTTRSQRHGTQHWTLILLDVEAQSPLPQIEFALAQLSALLVDLEMGRFEDTETAQTLEGVSFRIGYGGRLFSDDTEAMPSRLSQRHAPSALLAALPHPWDTPQTRDLGNRDLCVELVSPSEEASARALVEIDHLIRSMGLPLRRQSTFSAVRRGSGRNWLGLERRLDPWGVTPGAISRPLWMAGGLYLAHMRLHLDLVAWRRLDQSEQSVLTRNIRLNFGPHAQSGDRTTLSLYEFLENGADIGVGFDLVCSTHAPRDAMDSIWSGLGPVRACLSPHCAGLYAIPARPPQPHLFPGQSLFMRNG